MLIGEGRKWIYLKELKESEHQKAIFQWAKLHPICKDYLFAIPNGGTRNIREAVNMRSQGVRKGVSDMMLAYPTPTAAGLWIELKRNRKSLVTTEQKSWLQRMKGVGYEAHLAYGYEEAIKIMEEYLK